MILGLFNLRGSDIEYNPVFFSYAIVTLNDLILFIDEAKLGPEILKHFQHNNVEVTVKAYGNIKEALSTLVS